MEKRFQSPTYGKLNLRQVVDRVETAISEDKEQEYVIALSTDSQCRGKHTCFVSTVLLYRKGRGGIFFYDKVYENRIDNIHSRMMMETGKTIDLARDFIGVIEDDFLNDEFNIYNYNIDLEIHCDFGRGNKSGSAIKDSIAWIKAALYEYNVLVRVKPEAVGASYVSDHFTR